MNNGNDIRGKPHQDSVEHAKLQATRDLIDSIDRGTSLVSLSSALPLAKRILESSIGGTAAATNTTKKEMTTVDAKGKGRRGNSILKKIQRSLSKSAPLSSDSETKMKMTKIEGLYKELWMLEGEEVANDVMLLLCRLTGSGTIDQHPHQHSSFTASQIVNDKPNPDWLGERGGDSQHHDGVEDDGTTRQCHSQPTTETSKASLSAGIRSHTHVELAIREEETTILRECLRFLQNIEGENIRFLCGPSSSSSSKNNHHQENGDEFMEQHEGMRIRPGLLPFHMDVETCVRHQSTRMLNSGSMDALRLCGEAGWLYSRIQSYITSVLDHKSNNSGLVVDGRVVPRALALALTKELKSYHSLLADLERELAQQLSSKASNRSFTARRLVIQLRGPIAKLRTMALLVDGISPELNGGQLLSALYLHSMHGDARHCALVNRILCSAALPWYDLLYDWTMRGILSTPTAAMDTYHDHNCSSVKNYGGGEFFITENFLVSDALMWHGRFVLAEHQIPHMPGIGSSGGILNDALAREVLVVGKGINFIRRCLHDTQWNLDLRDMIPAHDLSHASLGGHNEQSRKRIKELLGFHYNEKGDVAMDIAGKGGTILTQTPLEQTVTIASRQVHRHILTSLFDQHHLLLHLHGLKEVLFLGQGDFICALMDGLHIEFDSHKGTDGIYMHSMMGVLQDALRTTNAKFLPKFVTERIYVKLLPTSSVNAQFWSDEQGEEEVKKDGWDIFSLGYEIDAPLTAVVHPDAMEKYNRVFTLLFRLKRIEWMLNNTWRQSTVLTHALQLLVSKYGDSAVRPPSSMKRETEFSRMKLLLRKFSMTRQTMLHFVNNLQSYLMFEVLESGWKHLVQKMKEAKSLDEVVCSHNDYLDKILVKSLLGEAFPLGAEDDIHKLGMQLRLVLTVSYRFCKSHEKIFSEALRSIDKATAKRRNAESRTNAGKWGFNDIDEDVGEPNFYNLSGADKIDEIITISDKFDASLYGLLLLLNDKVNNEIPVDVASSTPSRSMRGQGVDRVLASNNDALRFLTFRLDFSEYYNRRMGGKSY